MACRAGSAGGPEFRRSLLIDRSPLRFGAVQLLADIKTRLRVPVGGGRATDPDWTERRLVPLAPRTLKRLEAITEDVRARSGVSVEPMQLAALLLEKTTDQLNEDDVKDLVTVRRRAGR